MPWEVVEIPAAPDQIGLDFRTRPRKFLVIAGADITNPTRDTAAVAPGVPNLRSGHPYDPFAYLDRKMPMEVDGDRRTYYVDCYYTTRQGPRQNEPDNPLADQAKMKFRWERESEPMEIDIDGASVVASCGKPYNPLPTRPTHIPIVTFVKNFAGASLGALMYWDDVLNSDVFFGWKAGEILLNIEIQEEKEKAGILYYPIAFTFKFKKLQKVKTGITTFDNRSRWDALVLDRHVYGRESVGGVNGVVWLRDANGKELREPILLDGAGNPLNPSFPFETTPEIDMTPIYRSHARYERREFGDLVTQYNILN